MLDDAKKFMVKLFESIRMRKCKFKYGCVIVQVVFKYLNTTYTVRTQ